MLVKASVPVAVLMMSERCHAAASLNISLQLGLFLLPSHLPALLTRRMSWVDISWPWGLVTIGLGPLLTTRDLSSLDTRTWLVSGAYILSGLRMGLGGLYMASKGHLAQELPRLSIEYDIYNNGVINPLKISVSEDQMGQAGNYRGQQGSLHVNFTGVNLRSSSIHSI